MSEKSSKRTFNTSIRWQTYVEVLFVRCVWGLGVYYSIWLPYYFTIPIVLVTYVFSVFIEKKLFHNDSDVNDPSIINSYVTSEGNLPSWVMYPDVERTAWLNEIIKQMWPFINHYVHENYIGKLVSGFQLKDISMGDISPYLCGIKFYAGHNISRRSFVMDIGIIYAGNALISGVKKGYKIGIKDFGMTGKLRFSFEPLTTNPPFIGGISITIVPTPKFLFSLFDRLFLSSLPIIGDIIHSKFKTNFENAYVYPNKKEFIITKGVQKNQEKFLPQGVLLIHVDKVEDMKNNFKPTIFNKGIVTEIYVEIIVGSSKLCTKTIKDTNPTNLDFDEYFETIVSAVDNQVMTVQLKDANHSTKKDSFYIIDLEAVCRNGKCKIKINYEGMISGNIHMDFMWKTISDNVQFFTKQNRTMTMSAHSSNALLIVYLDSAARLSNIYLYKGKGIKVQGDPSPYVRLVCNQQSAKSEICKNTGNPIWQQSFEFIVNNAETDALRIWIEDSGMGIKLGKLVIPFYQLIKAPKMTLNQPFLFSDGANESYVFMKLVLKALIIKDLESIMKENLSAEEMIAARTTPRMSIWKGLTLLHTPSSGDDLEDFDYSGDGKIRVTLNYKAAKEILNIYIHNAIHIVPKINPEKDRIDSFIRLRILPNDVRKSRSTTRLCKASSHPHYNENFQVVMPRNYVTSKTTYLGLYIVGSTKNEKQLLGVASIKLNDMDIEKPTTLWYSINVIEGIEFQSGTNV